MRNTQPKLKDFIHISKTNPFSLQLILDMIDKIEPSSWYKALVADENNNVFYDAARNCLTCRITGSNKYDDLDGVLGGVAQQALNEYIELCKGYLTLTRDEGFNILNYDVNGEYKTHVDTGTGISDLSSRKVTMIIYLNDDYKGGELYFPLLRYKIKPKKGDIVVFPSSFLYPHCALPVKKGRKLAVNIWYH
jgi:hypothetical protein